ncbi:hypothetical protein TrST_g9209 [Triparma strigata]|uniref:EF-hand domain-containing protein n=1 Tax=Triparma strigata TaxID=1606541 RepID=A0A9W7EFZ4_9STRA|nr:hypothetical protein TrST_g9209 [Triparma strigata]
MSIPANASTFFSSSNPSKSARVLVRRLASRLSPRGRKQSSSLAFLGLTALLVADNVAPAHCGAEMSMSSSQEDEGRPTSRFPPLFSGFSSSATGATGDDDDDELLSTILESYGPIGSQVTMGTVFGYCSGYASKQIGKAIALVIGTGFMAVQAAAYSGYLDVKWNKVQEDVTKLVDADGDGKLTQKDVLVYWKKIKHVMTFNLPSSGGFGVGFLLGLSSR